MIAESPLLEARGLGRQAQGKWLVRDVSLSIGRGDRIALSGPNGAGKSVLMRLLSALDPADEGRLLWRGEPIADADVPAFRRRVGYCPQCPVFLPGTVEHNLRIPFSLRCSREPLDDARAAELLEAAGLSPELLGAWTEHLSGGERLAAALLRAMLLSPEILLLDEPTAALDEQAAPQAEQLVDMWMNESPQRAFLWITHDSRQAERIGRRRLRMSAGRLSGQSEGEE